jgi:hypothetical protein
MVTTTRRIRSGCAIRALRRRLTSLLSRRACASEPADGWFTLQSEPGDLVVSEPVTIAGLRSGATNQSLERASASSAVRSQSTERDQRDHTTVHAITSGHRWVFAAVAVIGVMALTAILAASSQGTNDQSLIVAQRTQLAQLAAQRDQALVTARQAQSGQAAWRAQAFRWRTRALARSTARRGGATRGGARRRNRSRRR